MQEFLHSDVVSLPFDSDDSGSSEQLAATAEWLRLAFYACQRESADVQSRKFKGPPDKSDIRLFVEFYWRLRQDVKVNGDSSRRFLIQKRRERGYQYEPDEEIRKEYADKPHGVEEGGKDNCKSFAMPEQTAAFHRVDRTRQGKGQRQSCDLGASGRSTNPGRTDPTHAQQRRCAAKLSPRDETAHVSESTPPTKSSSNDGGQRTRSRPGTRPTKTRTPRNPGSTKSDDSTRSSKRRRDNLGEIAVGGVNIPKKKMDEHQRNPIKDVKVPAATDKMSSVRDACTIQNIVLLS